MKENVLASQLFYVEILLFVCLVLTGLAGFTVATLVLIFINLFLMYQRVIKKKVIVYDLFKGET